MSDGWRPIDSAPGDGPVLLWASGRYMVGTYDTDLDEWRDHSGYLITPEPTDWQPLPPPPRAAGESDNG